MTLVRVWRRQLIGGMGAAAIAPAALLASLTVLALAGGFGGVSALGQAFSGPAPPQPPPAAAGGGASAPPVPAALAAALSTPAAQPAAPSSGGLAVAGPAPATAGVPPSATSGPPASGRGPGAPTQRPAAPRAGAPNPSPSPQPSPQPTVSDRIVGVGTSVTSQVPGPGGAAATKGLQAAGSVLDSIAPIKAR